MSENIFGTTSDSATTEEVATNQPVVKEAEAPSADPYADLLKGITTDDGRQKYATVSDAINALPHAQTHIQKLEVELAELREARARELQEQTIERHPEPQPQNVPDVQAIDETQVLGLVDQVLSQREKQTIRDRNVQTVVQQMTEKFGSTEAADKAYNEKAQELGISLSMLNDVAASSPTAIMSFFGTTGASVPSKTIGSVNTAGMSQNPKGGTKGANPLLTGNMKDMQAEIERITKNLGY